MLVNAYTGFSSSTFWLYFLTKTWALFISVVIKSQFSNSLLQRNQTQLF